MAKKKRTFSIEQEIDDAIRVIAARRDINISLLIETALKIYLQIESIPQK